MSGTERPHTYEDQVNPLYVSDHYLTVDSVDGAGGSSVAQAVAKHLIRIGKKVSVVEMAHAKDLRIGEDRARKYPHPGHPRVGLAFLNQVKRVYKGLIIPQLNSNDLVIGVTTEVRSLVYGFLRTPEINRLSYIQRGIATLGLLPRHRVLVTASADTISQVLAERKVAGKLSRDDPDPKDRDAIQARLNALHKAYLAISTLPHSTVHLIQNDRTRSLFEIAQNLVSSFTHPSTQ